MLLILNNKSVAIAKKADRAVSTYGTAAEVNHRLMSVRSQRRAVAQHCVNGDCLR